MSENLPARINGTVVPAIRFIEDCTPFVNAGFYRSEIGIAASFPLDDSYGKNKAVRILNSDAKPLLEITQAVFHVQSVVCEPGEFPDSETGEPSSGVKVILELATGETIKFWGWSGRQALRNIVWANPPPWKSPLVLHYKQTRKEGKKVWYHFWTEDNEVFAHVADEADTPKKRK